MQTTTTKMLAVVTIKQGQDTENEREDLDNVLQWMSTFGNLERMRKEKAMINDIYYWA